MVHPIERLRYVARSSGAPADLLVRETATALAAFRGDEAGLVTACRRVVSRQLASAPLWWLCSRMLCAPDPQAEGRAAVIEIEDDPTPRRLAAVIPDDATVAVLGWQPVAADGIARRGDLEVLVIDVAGEGPSFVRHLEGRDVDAVDVPLDGLGAAAATSDLVLVEAEAVGPDGFLAVAGSRAAAAVARHAGIPVWLVAGVGRVLPARVWEALCSRLDPETDPWDRDVEIVPTDLVTGVVGPRGLETYAETISRTDCPIAPELFRPEIT